MKPECQLIGKNGNVFNLIGIVRTTLRENGLYTELGLFNEELEDLQVNGGRYDDVLMFIMKYVDVA